MAAMYRLPRLVDAPQVLHLPTSMYLMDTLNTCCHRDLGSTYYSPNQAAAALLEVRQEAVKSEGVAALEVRQEALLERLQQLRQQLDHLLSNKVAVNTQSSSTAIIGAAALSSPVKEEGSDAGAEGELQRLQESVLFRLRRLRSELDRVCQAGGEVALPAEPITLVEQQQCILGVIKALKEEVEFLASLHIKAETKRSTVHDLVISASPEAPPFSLLLLRRLLKTAGISVYCANHLHSSVSQVSERLQHWFMDQDPDGRSSCRVAFTLHWKDARVPSLMVDPLRQTPISGEVNIVRYVSRLFPLSSPYNYEASGTFATITETDHVLDQLSRQLTEGNNRERQAALRQLNARLGKTGWLMGTSCSIVDVLAWSLMRQKAMVDAGAPANVVKWYKTVNTLADLGESW
ncbi:aminoacyl tRNA synthase complex-interacting multifunctional protein 2 isoform X2 [Cherax quadricarinatus]|uniref:aminoacyl tRNA synthase complex-interacting multifunctional protein 2 isoform X2 n=1 Tax=Cherax quadricarinatus TaxID=27406 RepID=UPI00387E80A5